MKKIKVNAYIYIFIYFLYKNISKVYKKNSIFGINETNIECLHYRINSLLH